MRPVPRGGGLKGPASVAAEGAADLAAVHAILTQTAEPLSHRDGLHAVTALVHAQVAVVAEHDLIVVFAVAFPADGAKDVLLRGLGKGVGGEGGWLDASLV